MSRASKWSLAAVAAVCAFGVLAKDAPQSVSAPSPASAGPASGPLLAEPPLFVPYTPPPQKAAALAAWRNASFGLFLHFGVYSTFGGEYEGKRSGAYAEWLMNNVRIPLADYRKKVAGVFNPTEFNADEWAQTAKAAGMRYIVITSKHHDGFAMWDSKVTDYNVVAATPFHRDVIGELAKACKKHGLLFGLYYSQAQDWSHPGGQRNTWDFPWQPTEKWWWRTADGKRNLQWAEHFKRSWQYVNEKAMPQLEEIITKYDPDILWWDTGSMLPYEMTRAMFDRANQLKPSIVMNDRNGDYYSGSDKVLDYHGTPDKPRYFQPVDGYWEAIPTTNESYGYSKLDKSHKKPPELIELLARAASKGGNVLMNVGPMGTGKFAPEDMAILKGIGAWMNVNSEAIYGAERTPLPVQPWGTSSKKGNDVYLFVFDKPKAGALVVGDLQSDPKGVTLLGGGQLPVRRLDADHIQITLPATATAATIPVIKLAFGETLKSGGALPVSHDQVNNYRIFDAKLAGGVGYGSNTYARAGATDWKSPQGRVSWPLLSRGPGTYKVSVTYNREKGIGGGVFEVAAAGQSLKHVVEKGDVVPDLHTGDVITRDLGTLTLPAGRMELGINAVKIPPGEDLVRFIGVTLTPVDAKSST
jgi:alpha-L-fucosidase